MGADVLAMQGVYLMLSYDITVHIKAVVTCISPPTLFCCYCKTSVLLDPLPPPPPPIGRGFNSVSIDKYKCTQKMYIIELDGAKLLPLILYNSISEKGTFNNNLNWIVESCTANPHYKHFEEVTITGVLYKSVNEKRFHLNRPFWHSNGVSWYI